MTELIVRIIRCYSRIKQLLLLVTLNTSIRRHPTVPGEAYIRHSTELLSTLYVIMRFEV